MERVYDFFKRIPYKYIAFPLVITYVYFILVNYFRYIKSISYMIDRYNGIIFICILLFVIGLILVKKLHGMTREKLLWISGKGLIVILILAETFQLIMALIRIWNTSKSFERGMFSATLLLSIFTMFNIIKQKDESSKEGEQDGKTE